MSAKEICARLPKYSSGAVDSAICSLVADAYIEKNAGTAGNFILTNKGFHFLADMSEE
jgi:hypothetical protein